MSSHLNSPDRADAPAASTPPPTDPIADSLIIEGIVTTLGPAGETNIAPMGPIVSDDFSRLVLRPFRTSATFANLRERGAGVFHVTDDVELLARSAVDRLERLPALRPASRVAGQVLADACRWFEFRVIRSEERDERTRFECEVVASGRGRDFLGFNRASHAVLEAAILATRLHLLAPEEVDAELRRLSVIVDKTAGTAQRRAFEFLRQYVAEKCS